MDKPNDRLKELLRSKMAKTPEAPTDLKDRIWNRIQNESRPIRRWKPWAAALSASAAMIALFWFQQNNRSIENDESFAETQIVEDLSVFMPDESDEVELASFYDML